MPIRRHLSLADRFDIVSLAVDEGVIHADSLQPSRDRLDGVHIADRAAKALGIAISSANARDLLRKAQRVVDDFIKSPAPCSTSRAAGIPALAIFPNTPPHLRKVTETV